MSQARQQSLTKSAQKQRKEQLQEQLKEMMQQIKQTYYEFLSSLKFQNLSDQQSYKQTMKHHQQHQPKPTNQVYDVDKVQSFYDERLQYSQKQSISELQLKNYSFEEQLSTENKGYMCFLRLINNIKQLQDYNHFLRSIVMSSDDDQHLSKFQQELLQDLKKLQIDIPAHYFGRKL